MISVSLWDVFGARPQQMLVGQEDHRIRLGHHLHRSFTREAAPGGAPFGIRSGSDPALQRATAMEVLSSSGWLRSLPEECVEREGAKLLQSIVPSLRRQLQEQAGVAPASDSGRHT